MTTTPEELSELVTTGLKVIADAGSVEDLASADSDLLGRRSRLTEVRAELRDLDEASRKALGRALNDARGTLSDALDARKAELTASARDAALLDERRDLTEALGRARIGHLHPITLTWERLEDVFVGMGFTVEDGPEIETDWFNFEALNLPRAHPARSLWDTLYVDADADADADADRRGDTSTRAADGTGEVLLRTHTSPVQVRTMLRAAEAGTGPPLYVVCPGRVYRRDTADATHLPVFHQIEGLVVDRGISMGDLAGTIEEFTKAYFGETLTSRLRPSYFPFTEPSAEVDISTSDGSWLEVGGCGMVHPNVLAHCGLDPEEWTGFAFGFGIDRLAKIRHGITDLREFVANDMRFLEQF